MNREFINLADFILQLYLCEREDITSIVDTLKSGELIIPRRDDILNAGKQKEIEELKKNLESKSSVLIKLREKNDKYSNDNYNLVRQSRKAIRILTGDS